MTHIVVKPVRVEDHLKLVTHLAKQYGFYPGSSNWDDALQAGYVGLVEAAARFDPKRGNQFSTYASRWIAKYLIAHRLASTTVVRKRYHFTHSDGPCRSLSVSIDSTKEGEFHAKKFAAPHKIEAHTAHMDAHRLLERVPPEVASLIRRRYGIGQEEETLLGIADQAGRTREAIRQREKVALWELRRVAGLDPGPHPRKEAKLRAEQSHAAKMA